MDSSLKSRLFRAAVLGLIIGLTGTALGLFSFGFDLEEKIGLHLLFSLRGERRVPPDVVIVSIDKNSAHALNLPYDTRKWPRTLHSRLIDRLVMEGASVIVFDMYFEEARSPDEDNAFASSMRKAGNVILCERIKREKVPLNRKGERNSGEASIVRLIPPVPPLAQSAAALAPFPLPKVPVRVSQYWTFTTGAGETPTLPIVAFQLFSREVYDEFIHLLERVSAYPLEKGFHDEKEFFAPGNSEKMISSIRSIFEKEPSTARWFMEEMERSKILFHEPKKRRVLESLIRMYRSPDSLYLNYYGPPGTISTIPYHQVLQAQKGASHDLRGKAVFVGLSELLEPEQKDGFYTVFSQADGRDLSGIEIAATAFANLMEDMPVHPLGPGTYIAVLFVWGLAMGFSCRTLPTLFAAAVATALSALYLVFALYEFQSSGRWYPVFTPLVLQAPFAFFGAVLWKYIDANEEKRNIRKAFGYYLPGEVVDRLAKNISDLRESSRLVHGACVCTDMERYSALAETMSPEELGRLMNKYYETVFKPVRQHEGTISDVIGDSMLALWVSVNPDPAMRDKACLAALDISRSMHQFNREHEGAKLHTRIGVHSGQILLGNIGAMDHYEYRPVGDMVNTATRIEGLNKHLGTRILVSDEAIRELSGFLTREIGTFLVAGKSKPLVVHELICLLGEADALKKELCSIFAETLEKFRRGSWKKAAEGFREVINGFGGDGPSGFYLSLCDRFIATPPEAWDGVVRMEKK